MHLKLKPMSVYGHEVSIEAQQVAVYIILLRSHQQPQTYADLQSRLADAGVPHEALARGADRLLQKLRKSGLLAWRPGAGWIPGVKCPSPDQLISISFFGSQTKGDIHG